jgi:cytochrome P450
VSLSQFFFSSLPYTESCIREMMRYETLVPLGVPHRAMSETKFHKYDIPEVNYVIFLFLIWFHILSHKVLVII